MEIIAYISRFVHLPKAKWKALPGVALQGTDTILSQNRNCL